MLGVALIGGFALAKPRSKPQLRLTCAHVDDDAAGIPHDDWCYLFFEHVYCLFDDAEFAALYRDGGRYPVSPALLASITILQYMHKVSDRQAVRNTVRCRDWRIALGRDKDWAGFDHSVLCNFRKRLVAHDLQRAIFERVLDKLHALGLLARRARLRMDATHLVSDVAVLSRADALREALRIVVCALHKAAPELELRPDFLRLLNEYGQESWLGQGDASPEALRHLGRDGQALLALCGDRSVPGQAVLQQMLAENFSFEPAADPTPLEPSQRPPDRIATPHEPDARVGKKGTLIWTGDKVHVVETADEDRVNFIVDMLVSDPRAEDSTVTEQLAQRARFALPEACELLADGGYASAANTLRARDAGFDLICPPRHGGSRGQLPVSCFDIDFGRQVACCPAGCASVYWRARGREITVRFPASACQACPLRAACTSNKRGRSLGLSRDHEQLQADRERAAGAAFRAVYRRRSGIEATISHLVRDCGLRRSRYRSGPRRELHALLAGAALNVRRLLSCLPAMESPRATPAAATNRCAGTLSKALKTAAARLPGALTAPNPRIPLTQT
jgi:hypothetical protein